METCMMVLIMSRFASKRYFNYRTTRFLAEEGFYKFHNWFDDRAWYPLGRIIGGTIYPGTLSEPEHGASACMNEFDRSIPIHK